MVLKYKGIKENWCYEEAKQIIVSHLNVLNVIKDEKKRWGEPRTEDESLEKIHAIHSSVDKYIKNKTGIGEHDYLTYAIGEKQVTELDRIVIVMMKDEFYILCKEAYLLDSNGRTIERL